MQLVLTSRHIIVTNSREHEVLQNHSSGPVVPGVVRSAPLKSDGVLVQRPENSYAPRTGDMPATPAGVL